MLAMNMRHALRRARSIQPVTQIGKSALAQNFIIFPHSRRENTRNFSSTIPSESNRTWSEWAAGSQPPKELPPVPAAADFEPPTQFIDTEIPKTVTAHPQEFVEAVVVPSIVDPAPLVDPFPAITSTDIAAAIVQNPDVIQAIVEPPRMAYAAVMSAIDNIHIMAGIPYWEAIIAVTVAFRIFLFPVAVKTMQGSAKMAIMVSTVWYKCIVCIVSKVKRPCLSD